MAKYSSKDVGFMLLGPFSLLGSVSKIEDTVELKLNDTSVLGQVDEDYWSSGAKKTEVVQDGWFDDAVKQTHEAFVGLSTIAQPMSIAPHGNVNARYLDIYPSVQRVGYTVQLSVGDVTKAVGRYGVWYGKRGSAIVHALSTETTAGNSDALDVRPWTANGANGGACVLHITALSGCTNCTITLRHSSDGVTYADKQVFAAVTPAQVSSNDALCGQYLTFSGTLNQYVSVSWAYSAPSSPSVTFMVGAYQAP